MSSKRLVRARLKGVLSALDRDQISSFSRAISKKLWELISVRFPKNPDLIIGVFSPIQAEPCVYEELESRCFLAFPALENDQMVFKQSSPQDLSETKEFGVYVLAPQKESQVVNPDVLIIPGLAFTKKRERLGRGKGFYDRFLKNFNGLVIGVCYEHQLVEDLPVEPHDQLVDMVVTESAVYEE